MRFFSLSQKISNNLRKVLRNNGSSAHQSARNRPFTHQMHLLQPIPHALTMPPCQQLAQLTQNQKHIKISSRRNPLKPKIDSQTRKHIQLKNPSLSRGECIDRPGDAHRLLLSSLQPLISHPSLDMVELMIITLLRHQR